MDPHWEANNVTPLAELSTGRSGTIRALNGGRRFVGRLAALGFTPGVAVTMVRNNHFGPVIVAVRGTQVALGRGEAHRVMLATSGEGGT